MVPRLTSWLLPAVLPCATLTQAWSTNYNLTEKCSSLAASISIPDVTVNFAQFATYNLSTCPYPYQVVFNDLCRVAMRVATSRRSEITLEAWLPTNWNGRFLSTGNGGISGCIQYIDLAYTASFGFASVGANNGHNGTSGISFYENPDVVADFAYRSMHTGVVVGKKVSEAFYGKAHNTSYYLGCSTGGRQGLKSVQDFPEDFDGVIAGAPAAAFNNLTSWSGHFLTILGNATSPTFVPLSMWPVIHQEILDQCDGIDGVVDGIIEDPTLCQFRPEALQCPPGSGNSTNCLTSLQVLSVRQIFSDYYGVDGALIYPRMQPGSELIAQFLYYTGTPFPYTTDWFRYAIYNNPSWDPNHLTVQDAAHAAHKNPFDIETWNGDLSAFKSRGGKLLQYHGQQDPVISSDNSPRYYDHVSTTMGLPYSYLDDFYRFFRISGMGHCTGGPGAWQIGQTYGGAAGNPLLPQDNILLAMMAWVEQGIAPETVTGTKYINDTPSLGLNFTRNHCRYPFRNTLIDPARYQEADAWECK
ncbi:tannase and feruloyl esterase [Mollisia scopiformis]|uniref:Carboxylic ester hydrolase n=1 Tax=Mollisia scopiformis TaxID=149040 RepID=A0A132B983_MOLSC|nr:tannase and feruloyl esterase [Mollisia scopiformis]KUJ08955.1 tannase and feruloyl esterase [Mollisia scopiformis]